MYVRRNNYANKYSPGGGGTLNNKPLKKSKVIKFIILIVSVIFIVSITGQISYAIFTSSTEGANTLKLTVAKRKLNDIILGKNEKNVVSSGDGLYKSIDTNDGKPTYYYHGNVTDNWVSFANQTWRIVRINENGTIRLIRQKAIDPINGYRYSSATDSYIRMYYFNTNTATGFEGILKSVNTWYNENIKAYEDNLATTIENYQRKTVRASFCGEAKAVAREALTIGDKTMPLLSDTYSPSFKCSTVGDGTGVISLYAGLLTLDEILFAGYPKGEGKIVPTGTNLYLMGKDNARNWTMSPGGGQNQYNLYGVWQFSSNGQTSFNWITTTYSIRPVINIKKDVEITGKGIESNPYVIVD